MKIRMWIVVALVVFAAACGTKYHRQGPAQPPPPGVGTSPS